MKLIIQRLYAVVALCLFGACTSETTSESDLATPIEISTEVGNNIVLAEEVLDVLNNYRTSLDLDTLIWHTGCENLATGHSFYMVRQNEASHDNFLERSEILKNGGANFVSENVAYGFSDAEAVLQGWLNSPSHKRAIEGDYTHTGIGIAHTENGIPYYTQLFVK